MGQARGVHPYDPRRPSRVDANLPARQGLRPGVGGDDQGFRLMSGGKGGSTTQKTTIDPRLTDALLNNNAQSQWVANQLGARQFADFTPDQLAAFDQLRGAGGWGMDALQQAMAAMQGAANYDPQMVQAGSLLDMDLSAYMNPYTSQVVDTALADIDRFGQMQQAQ